MIDHDATDVHIQVHGNSITVIIEGDDSPIGGTPQVHSSLSVEGVINIIRSHLSYDERK